MIEAVLTEDESRELASSADDIRRVREEIAGVWIYLLCVSYVLGVYREQAMICKMALNERKYPRNRRRIAIAA